MIALSKFISDDSLIARASKPSQVVCLSLEYYSPLFCRALVDFIAKKNTISVVSQPMAADTMGFQMAGLQTTFLGQNFTYWLHSDTTLSKKESDDWHLFLSTYNGPHTLIISTIKQDFNYPKSWTVIGCPTEIDVRLFKQLSVFFAMPATSNFSSLLFEHVRALPLDTAVLLHQYGALIGKNAKPFMTDWLPSIVVPEQSLFTLSQALFSRNITLFFKQWQSVKNHYPLQFWLIFWSEQVWRAYCYIRMQKAGKIADAKKIGYRLPFMFLQKDWRSYSLEHLLQAHHSLYLLDYHVKNGGSEECLELFYNQFFILVKLVSKK